MDLDGTQLTAVRKLRKMSCATLSKKLNEKKKSYTRNTISRKCNGGGGKTGEEAIKDIAQALEIDADVLTNKDAFIEYMELLDECKKLVENIKLDEGVLMFTKFAYDYLNGKDEGNKLGYVYRLLEDEKLFKELEGEAAEWRKRLDEIDTLMKNRTVDLGTGALLSLEPKKGEFYSRWCFIINDDIQRLFFMENHRIPYFKTNWVKGRAFNIDEIKGIIREQLKSYDTGSELLNEKLKKYVDRSEINYIMKVCEAEPQFDEKQIQQLLVSLNRYIEETEGNVEG